VVLMGPVHDGGAPGESCRLKTQWPSSRKGQESGGDAAERESRLSMTHGCLAGFRDLLNLVEKDVSNDPRSNGTLPYFVTL